MFKFGSVKINKINVFCVAEKTFKTKGEYYEHCEVAHPNLRHSWYITKQKYKIGALKQKKLKTKRTSESVGHRVFNESRILRSSPRIQSLYSSKSINKDPEIIANQYSSNFTDEELSDRVERGKDSSATESGSEVQEKTVDKVITNEEISVKENVREIVENSCVTSVSDYGMNLHLTHLPLKKRLEVRKHLSDVTNTHLYNVTPSEKSDVSLNNNNIHIFNKNLDEEHRAFISHIDFDDLNAILNLKSLKSNH